MTRLAGKTAILTGASRGIGAAAARRFAEEGARVAINHPPDEAMRDLAHRLVADIEADGGRAMAVAADVSDKVQVDRMVADVAAELGDADILVANAAASTRNAWTDIDVEQWDHTYAVNVRGTFLCARAVHDGMVRKGGGSIITLSSVTAHIGMVGILDYVSSKAAIVGLTRALAREIGPEGIRVNAVMPGAIRTENEEELNLDPEEVARRSAERQSLPRRGYAEDLAGTFVYLASDDSEFVTGQVIAVDGGWVHR